MYNPLFTEGFEENASIKAIKSELEYLVEKRNNIYNLMLFLAGRSSKYSKTPAGLGIENVSRSDRGVYICRARVANTGQMEERKIEVEVSGGDCGASSCLSAVIIFPDQRTSALGSEAI